MEFPTGFSPPESIPNEVLTMIAETLAPGDDDELHNSRGKAAYKEERRMLLNLCLVSKRMEAVVRPVLFSQVFIYHSTELILFYRSLNENHKLGEYVQMLILATVFLRNHKDHEALDFRLLRGFDSDFDLIRPHSSAGIPSLAENQVRTNVYLKILSKAQYLTAVAINIPSWLVRGLDDGHLTDFRQTSIISANRLMPAQAPELQHRKALTTLAIEGHVNLKA